MSGTGRYATIPETIQTVLGLNAFIWTDIQAQTYYF